MSQKSDVPTLAVQPVALAANLGVSSPSEVPPTAAPEQGDVDAATPPVLTQGVSPDLLNPFAPPPAELTQKGPRGIRYDFNEGVRVKLPKGNWKVTLKDTNTGNILFLSDVTEESLVSSTRKYFVPFSFEVKDNLSGEVILSHEMNLKGKEVLVQFPVGTLGDSVAWFSYLDRFRTKHECKLVCVMSDLVSPLFVDSYPDIRFITKENVATLRPYASYYIGLFFRGDVENKQPADFRLVGLHKTAAHILGVDTKEQAPTIKPFERTILEKYVCIAVQSSTQCKYWNNPFGWRDVVKHLKKKGYRVLCIDKADIHGTALTWNHIPHGAEDFTGAHPLTERAALLQHAEFFIGVSSGLSWLAWACGIPVVMVSGMTHPINEFESPYRIHNTNVCNSCWNDGQIIFDHFDFFWCPRHKGTERQFECSKLITSEHVIKTIDRVIADLDAGRCIVSEAPGAQLEVLALKEKPSTASLMKK